MTSFSSYAQNNPVADNSPGPGFFAKNVVNPIKSAFSSGINQIQQGASQIGSGQGNPIVQGTEGALKIGAGLVGAVSSPLAPVVQRPLGAAVNATGNEIAQIPAVQNFATTPAGQTTVRVAGDLSNAGAVAGGILGAGQLEGPTGNIWDKVNGTPTDTLASRVSDATPNYKQVLKSEDITGNVTNAQGESVPRVNEGVGVGKKSTITPSASETDQGTTLNDLPNYPDRGTYLQKAQAVNKGISTEAEGMRAGLQAEDKTSPLDTEAEKSKIQNLVKSNLPEEIHSKLGVLSPEDESMLKGMNKKVGQPNPKGGFDLSQPGDRTALPKTAANKFYQKVLDATKNYDGTREGKLDLRQAIDVAYEQEGGKYAHGSDAQNSLYETHSDIRDSLNKDLAETTKNTDTQASLKKQSNLYRTKDVLRGKAVDEARTTIGRFFQNHPILHRLVTRDALRVLGTASGAGIATSFITKLLQGKE